MAKALFLVYSGPADAAREAEYNEWYDDVHVPDMLGVPGIVACTRYRLAATQVRDPAAPAPYLAIYEVELDDLADLPGQLAARRRDATAGVASDALVVGPVAVWEPVTGRVS